MSATYTPLSERSLSLDHQALGKMLTERQNILIIQDLDGVCMGLVKDPLTRAIAPSYLKAAKLLANHFFVLTNGEHIGKRGVNRIVDKAFNQRDLAASEGLYLPGLAGGGVQWQDNYGNVSHPGVSEAELAFLAAVPQEIESCLQQLLKQPEFALDSQQIERCIQAAVLDNKVSPTANLNIFHQVWQDQEQLYAKLQQEMEQLMNRLLAKAAEQNLGDSFFIHYAPNLGRDAQGQEIMQPAWGQDSGTTDFQFMLKGAIKEVGVLVILNHYYQLHHGNYPLGAEFNARQAPHQHRELLKLIKDHFDPEMMPTIVGVGDTVTSKAEDNGSGLQFYRGGSDRGFLHLIQEIGQEFNRENAIVYVDSSDGEVKNRKPLKLEQLTKGKHQVVEGPGDARDTEDPLRLNIVFPGGYRQYTSFFQSVAKERISI